MLDITNDLFHLYKVHKRSKVILDLLTSSALFAFLLVLLYWMSVDVMNKANVAINSVEVENLEAQYLLYDLFFLSNKPLLETLADATLKRECRK
jgi:hypothetical protein